VSRTVGNLRSSAMRRMVAARRLMLRSHAGRVSTSQKSALLHQGTARRAGQLAAKDKNTLIQGLVATQRERLRRFLHLRVRNAADIPDIMQEVYLRLLRVPNHETIRVPERYIFTIARHVASQHNLAASEGGEFPLSEESLDDLGSSFDVDPLLEVAADQCLSVISAAVSEMSPKMQATFLLSRREGKSLQEISERLGISLPMAKKYMVQALTLCRKRLKESE